MGEENGIYRSKRIFEEFGGCSDGVYRFAGRQSFCGGK
jgi:hypothetical protein